MAGSILASSVETRGATCPDVRQVCAPAEPKSRPIIQAKFFIEKPPKTYKNYMNLLIFLDLTYNLCKNFKFYSLQGQNFEIVLIFTYKQGKIFVDFTCYLGGTCIPGLHWELPPHSPLVPEGTILTTKLVVVSQNLTQLAQRSDRFCRLFTLNQKKNVLRRIF